MKKVILLMVAAIALGLTACSNKDNTCVKDIVAILTDGAKQNQTDDLDNLFIMPDGNAFANEKVLAVIDANKDYKLTDDDKAQLKETVQQFKTLDGDSQAAELERLQVKMLEADIDAAITLSDLVDDQQ
jgi:hypothetical protein